jgi:isoleucyl-tRNA synthetase
LVVLDTEVTPELEREGVARDLIRKVQQARREADLDVSDRIALTIVGPSDEVAAFEAHRDLVMSETLSVEAVAEVGEPAITVTAVAR